MSDDKEWIPFGEALDKIVRDRNISPERAQNLLVAACASKRVGSRYFSILAVDSQRMQLSHRAITPGEWDGSVVPVGVVNLATGTFRAVFDDNSEGPIEINANQLNQWLARPRGPKAGTVSRFGVSDQTLFPRITRLIHDGKAASPTEAARLLVGEGLVAGAGTEDSRARRLAKSYLAATR